MKKTQQGPPQVRLEEAAWALITGASSGIGAQLSHILADEGINLIVHGRNKTALEALAQELRDKVHVELVCADLSQDEQRRLVVRTLHEKAPQFIINNAGYGLYGEALSHPTADQMAIAEVNTMAVLEITLEGAKALVRHNKEGVICNIASVAAFPVFPNFAAYAASKAFVVSLSQSLDEEIKGRGVRVLAACPGMVNTNFRQRAGAAGEDDSPLGLTMSASFAAQQIWQQIRNKKQMHIFGWVYRIAIFLVLYLLPKKWVAASLGESINRRYPPKPFSKH